jgi:dTDP-4-dehydrorhamnose 3,5-epimerase
MTARVAATLEGVHWERVVPRVDERGSFSEVWRASRVPGRFLQANVSTSARGVLRGVHCHRAQGDYFVVLSGRVYIALVDLRPILRGDGSQIPTITRECSAGDALTIPPLVAHGFLALEPTQLLYLVTAEYDSKDEFGFRWDDPATGIKWPRAAMEGDGPILSERDRSSPSLANLVEVLRKESRRPEDVTR